MILIIMEWNFLCKKKILIKLKRKTMFALKFFVTKTSRPFQSTFQINNLKFPWICCLWLMKTSHIMCTLKILTDSCFTKQFHETKNKNKKYFCKSCVQCFGSKQVLIKHKEVCLSINGAQFVTLVKGKTEFKNFLNKYQFHLKSILILSVILSDRFESYEGSYSKKYQNHIPCSCLQTCLC